MVEGLSHITFICRDLERMSVILKHVMEAQEIYDSGENTFSKSKEKFFTIGNVWVAVMEGESLTHRSYNHVAFKVPDSELDGYLPKIQSLGLDVEPPRPRVSGEGRSIYFYDEDNHLFELHSGTLSQRLQTYRGHNSDDAE